MKKIFILSALIPNLMLISAHAAAANEPVVQQTSTATVASAPVHTASKFSMGVCDANEVFYRAKAIQEFEQHRENRLKEYQKSFVQQETNLRKEHEKLEDKMKLGKEAYIEAEKGFQGKVDEARKRFEEMRKKIDLASADAEKKVKEEILKIVMDLKKKHSLGTVFDKGALLISDEVHDLTEEAVKLVNERLPSVKVSIPPVKG
ncbi:MAG: OmpH family outer membrane protein [Alphaproteobacteria bacterium]|jgi:outer membrane protein|nr:OmpH family outer membrane protein [Alphaproteobacteria bacterium]